MDPSLWRHSLEELPGDTVPDLASRVVAHRARDNAERSSGSEGPSQITCSV